MFDFTQLVSNSQRAVCLLLSAVVVTISLAAGVYMAKSAEHLGYSVTVTQIS